MIGVILGVLVGILGYFILKFNRKGSLPGPISFPIIGSYPQFVMSLSGSGIGDLFTRWGKKYGPIFRADLGIYKVVVLNDSKLIKEAFAIPALLNRVKSPVPLYRCGGDGKLRGILLNYGHEWNEQRKFTTQTLKGLARNKMEGIIQEETQQLVNACKLTCGKPISAGHYFLNGSVNVMWTLLAGKRFDSDDERLHKLMDSLVQIGCGLGGEAGAMIFFPILTKWFQDSSGWNTFIQSAEVLKQFTTNYVNERLKLHQPGFINDFIDAYIEKINNTTDPKSTFYKDEGIKNMIVVLEDLIEPAEAASSTMEWFMLCLALHPRVQKKLQKEIDNVIGTERTISLSDRSKMPYAEAVMAEGFRFSSTVQVGMPHFSAENTWLQNYLIPKNAFVISNINGAHHDPKVWGDPKVFRPERFLNSDESTFIPNESLIPFSTGKRTCVGDVFARDQLFLMVTSLFQVFDVQTEQGVPQPSLAPNAGTIMCTKPQRHKLCFLPRNNN